MKSLLNAIGFLTIIKVNKRYFLQAGQFYRCALFFPVVGILIGLWMAFFVKITSFVLPLMLSAVIAVCFEVMITGGLHLDGLSDSFDGVFSGETEPKKIIEIMKKGDIGVFGALSLIFSIIIKIVLLYYLFSLDVHFLVPVVILIFMPAFGRWSMLYLLKKYPSGKSQKSLTGIFYSEKNRSIFNLSTVYVFLLFFISVSVSEFFFLKDFMIFKDNMVFSMGLMLLKNATVLFLVYLSIFLSGNFFIKRIRELRGDIIGAVNEITEIIYLFFSFLFINILSLYA